MNSDPRISFTFPYRWLTDPEDRKYLGPNLIRNIQKGGLKQVMSSSASDKYYAQHGPQAFIPAYAVVIKTHAYQPVKIKLTQAQLQTLLKPVFGISPLASFQTFFVQTSNQTALPVMEMEVYY